MRWIETKHVWARWNGYEVGYAMGELACICVSLGRMVLYISNNWNILHSASNSLNEKATFCALLSYILLFFCFLCPRMKWTLSRLSRETERSYAQKRELNRAEMSSCFLVHLVSGHTVTSGSKGRWGLVNISTMLYF